MTKIEIEHWAARLAPMGESGGKTWYEITFQGAEA